MPENKTYDERWVEQDFEVEKMMSILEEGMKETAYKQVTRSHAKLYKQTYIFLKKTNEVIKELNANKISGGTVE